MMSVMNNSEDFELGILVKVDDDVSNIVGIDLDWRKVWIIMI